MKAGLVAAIIVMIIITLFTFIILRIIAVGTGSKIRDNVIKQMQTYDVLLQKKASELHAIQKQIELEQEKLLGGKVLDKNKEQALPNLFLPMDAKFRDQDFSQDYKKLKEEFVFDPKGIICEISKFKKEQLEEEKNILLESLLDKFSFQNVFQLSVLHSKEQLEVIKDIISEEEEPLFLIFMKQNKEFSSLAFYQWLYVQKEFGDKLIRVRTAESKIDYSNLGETIKTEYDENLCEGFQILTGNKLYDYGVRKCELL